MEDSGHDQFGRYRRVVADRFDVFGYFLPGLVLNSSLIVWSFSYHELPLSWIKIEFFASGWAIIASGLFGILILSYILGQLIASFSIILFEKILVGKIYGYPFKIIIFDYKEFRNTPNSNYYRTVLSTIYLVILFYILRNSFFANFIPTWQSLAIFFGSILIYHLFEKLVKKYWGKSKLNNFILLISKWVFRLLAVPYLLGEHFFRGIMDLDRPISLPARKAFKDKFFKRFGFRANKAAERDVYWLSYLYVMENSSYSKETIYKWLILSALHRNMACSMLLSSIFLSLPFSGHVDNIHYNLFIPTIVFVLSILLVARYYFIFSGYLSKSVFRRFIAMN